MGITPQQAAIKWRDRLVSANQQIVDGVNAVNVAPGQSAAKQKDLWLRRVQASADKWARNTAAVSLEDWRKAMIEVGIPRVSSGANAKVDKVERFMSEFLPHVNAVAARVRDMPKGDLSMSIARMTAMVQGTATFKRQSR